MDVGELEEILHECNGTIKQSVYFGTSHEGEKIYVEMKCRLPTLGCLIVVAPTQNIFG